MLCETDVLFSSNFGWFSISLTVGVGGFLLNGQNPLSVTKVICRRSLRWIIDKSCWWAWILMRSWTFQDSLKLFNSLSFIWKKGNLDKQIGQYQEEKIDFSFSYLLMVIPMQSRWFHWSHRSHWIELASFGNSSLHNLQGYSWVTWRAMLMEAVKAQWGNGLCYIAIFDRSLVW